MSRERRGRLTAGRTRWGFDRFWGFLGGEAGQYDPVITQDNTTLGVPEGRKASRTTCRTT